MWTQGQATYTSGNGTDALVFEYTVLKKDRDENGVDAFVPHGRDIKATGTEIANQPNPGGVPLEMGEDSNHKVDGSLVSADTIAPTVSSVSFADSPGPGDDETNAIGDWIGVHVTFSESVLVTGAPQVELNVGGTARQAEAGHLPAEGQSTQGSQESPTARWSSDPRCKGETLTATASPSVPVRSP